MTARVRWLALALLLLAGWALWFRLARPARVLVGSSEAELGTTASSTVSGHAGLALLVAQAGADWEAEILAGYGLPWAESIDAAGVRAALDAGVERWVVPNVELAPALRASMQAAVEAGAWLVELGPKSAVCGAAATGAQVAEGPAYRVDGEGLRDVRWPAPVALVPGCEQTACAGATILAHVTERAEGGKSTPLVTRHKLGQGTCTRWHGDLAAAMQRLRQGAATRAGTSAVPGLERKPSDLFAGDLEPLDYEIPSADRLGFALAAQIVEAPGPDVLLAPLPAGSRGLVIFTADQDFVPGPGVLAQSAALGGAGLTVTLTSAEIGGKPDVVFAQSEPGLMEPDDVATLAEREHDVGIHPNLVGLAPAAYAKVFVDQVAAFKQAYGVSPRIVRNHHLIWLGYTEMARLQAAAGLVLNLDYVTARGAHGYTPGFMTGSGLALRLRDERGRMLPMFQLATQIDDYLFLPGEVPTREQALSALTKGSARLLAVSRQEQVPVTLLHHPAWWHESGGAFQRAVLSEAARHGMRVWSAGRFLSFVEETRRTQLRRSADRFDVTSLSAHGVLLLEGAERWTIDGKSLAGSTARVLGGHRYRELTLPVGQTHLEARAR